MTDAQGTADTADGAAPGVASYQGVSALHVELRDLAVDIARQAGAYLAAHADDHLTVHTKSTPTDAVTDVDRASEALIVRLITENRPDDGILGEEGTSRPGSSGVRWIVDPLDGTVNYLYGIGAYAVSIGVEVDGVAAAGAVYDAARGHLYDAVLGGGARRDGRPLTCSGATDLALALVGTGFGYAADVRADQGALVARLLPHVRDIRRFGSAALDICAVASGRLDGYYERGINPWDRAAGLLIAAEAGARTGVFAEPGTDRELTMAATPAIFDALKVAVRP
jgi:myo-inositol-1(or 4)-monophosphatase